MSADDVAAAAHFEPEMWVALEGQSFAHRVTRVDRNTGLVELQAAAGRELVPAAVALRGILLLPSAYRLPVKA